MAASTLFRISEFIAFEASGSDISNPAADNSGYDHHLACELRRLGVRGGTLDLTRPGLLDLAEWLDAIQIGMSDTGNTAGARSCQTHAERARKAAQNLPTE